VKFTVTALGAQAGGEADTARRIANYLMGRAPDQNRPMVGHFGATAAESSKALAGYYRADQLEGDGWWGGTGASRLGLAGTVDAEVLEQLLAGRHPVTGERLLSARGSSGRAGLKRGQHCRVIDGVEVWGIADAAARLDVSRAAALVAAEQLDPSLYLVDPERRRWLTWDGVVELSELLDVAPTERHQLVLARLEDAPEELTTGQAAALTGTTEQHIRQIIGEWAENRDAIEAGETGRHLPWKRAWLPARRDGGRWRIARADLADYWERRRPPAVRQAYDVVATVEKSVSLLTLLSGPATKQMCVEAIVAANAAGMAHLDRHASRGRRKGSSISSEGFVWASFMHATSRSLDPHPHIHNVVMNVIEDPLGQRRAVDARFLFVEAQAATALATAQLRWELHQAFPRLRWERSLRSGVWEIAGVSAELIKEFSTRRSEIEAAASELISPDGTLPTRSELQEISRTTRSAKKVVDAATVLADWMARAEALRFDEATVLHRGPVGTPAWSPSLNDAEKAELFEFLATSPAGACREESTFDHGDLLMTIAQWGLDGQPRPMPAATVVSLADEFLATHLAIPVEHHGGLITRRDGRTIGALLQRERWTTPDMVRTQVAIVHWWGQGLNMGHLLDVADTSIDSISQQQGLGPEQAELIRSWSASGDQFQAAIGQPGTGKTFTMRAARLIWEQHGYRVLGAAVKGTAAQHLGRETGIPSETVAHYLTAATMGLHELDARTVLVVDEATTLSDRDLHALMQLCRRSGAALRMIGDPAQQQSVAAGGMWEHMVTTYRSRTPELSLQQRLQDPDEIRTAQLLRHGQIEEAFNALLAAGKIKQAEDPVQGELIALAGWLERLHRGVHAPMIDRRNVSRERLNLIAQAIRVRAGQVGELHAFGERSFGVGDQVVATQPHRRLFPVGSPRSYLSNGSTGEVVAADAGGLRVRFEGLGEIDVPARVVRSHLDLGYAITAFSVQGLTLDEAESTARPGEEIHSLYVMLTRGRRSNTLITTRPLAGEAHGVDTRPDRLPVVEVAESIVDSTLKPAVVADRLLPHLIDPDATDADAVDLDDVARRLAEADLARAIRLAQSNPPAVFVEQFPPRPAAPWLANGWDAALRAVVTYHHRWPAGATGSSAGHALLGSEPPEGTEQHADWAAAGDDVARHGLAITLRHLKEARLSDTESRRSNAADTPQPGGGDAPEGGASGPAQSGGSWLVDHLRTNLEAGAINPSTDFAALATWIGSVAVARVAAGLTGDHQRERPEEVTPRERLDRLMTHDPLPRDQFRAPLSREL